MSRTTDHEDSRRLASGLSPDLSSTHEEDSGLGRQTDPGDRRTSDWRSPTLGSDGVPSTGRPMRVSPTLIGSSSDDRQPMPRLERSRETERDTAGNASRILMTGLRRPGQRGVTTGHKMGSPTARFSAWLWAKLLQEEYPEGYSMNTRSTPREVEALQARAREYTRQQVEQMDEWERAFYREWTSLMSRNALAFPYPMESESEAQTPIATPIHGYVGDVGGSASSTDILVPGFHDRPHRDWDTNPLLRTMEGTLEDGTTTSESIQTTPAFQNWNSTNFRRSEPHRSYPREQVRPEETGGIFPDGVTSPTRNSIPFPHRMEGTLEDGTTTSGSTQTTIASRTRNSDTLPRGTVLRRDRRTGRTRRMVTGEFIPEEEEPLVSAINVGTLKATTSDEDKYCMLDSGANVMVVPLMRKMQGDKTMCSLVGDKKTQGLIISRL